jgi:hypothetical protein
LAGLQSASIDVPETTEYNVAIDTGPSGWQVCPKESPTRKLTENDFTLGKALVEWHFWKGCASQGTPTTAPTGQPTDVPTGQPTAGPTGQPTSPPPPPTAKPPSPGGEKQRPALGAIHGLAFIDLNGDGKLGSDEPGLNDVGVNLHGGGLELVQVTGGTGQYSFDGLGAGSYDVFIEPGPEWRVTTPAKYVVSVNGDTVMGYDFGLVRVGAAGGAPAGGKTILLAGRGIRLPATGITTLPMNGLLGLAAAVLGMLALVGLSTERYKHRH